MGRSWGNCSISLRETTSLLAGQRYHRRNEAMRVILIFFQTNKTDRTL